MTEAPELKLGKRDPVRKPAIAFGDVLRATPAHPESVDYLAIPGWEMLGNDRYGDCVAVTWANARRLLTRQVDAEHYPDLDAVLTLYRTQNPGFPQQDDGMDIQLCLEHLVSQGGPDGVKAVAFARVNLADEDEVRAALALFGFLWVGVQVQSMNMSHDVPNGVPWDYYRSANIGGHSIIVGGYDSDNVGGDQTMVTWGKHTSMTDAFWSHQVDEAWVCIWPEHLTDRQFLDGISLPDLAAAYHDLTGRELPLPDQPTPAPSSAPDGPSTLDQVLWSAVSAWVYARHTTKATKAVATELLAWARSKGLAE